MKWRYWTKLINPEKPAKDVAKEPSLTACPKCGDEMDRIEKSTMSGDDMRTYRCARCADEHIINFGPALWKVLSDANKQNGE